MQVREYSDNLTPPQALLEAAGNPRRYMIWDLLLPDSHGFLFPVPEP